MCWPLISRKPSLDDSKKVFIILLNKQKKSISEISSETSRSRAVITKYIKIFLNYYKKKSSGRTKKIFLEERSKPIEIASGKNITANKLKHILDLNMHKSTITRILAKDGGLKRKKRRKPASNFEHKKNK